MSSKWILKVILSWVLLIIFIVPPIYFIGRHGYDSIHSENIVSQQLDAKSVKHNKVTLILNDINDKKISDAIEKITKLQTSKKDPIPENVIEYLNNFIGYCALNDKKLVKFMSTFNDANSGILLTYIQTSYIADLLKNLMNKVCKETDIYKEKEGRIEYLYNHITDMVEYFDKELKDKKESYKWAEIIPFYCITEYERKYGGRVYNACNAYLNHISDKADSLSEKGAYIACIKIQYLYSTINRREKIFFDDGTRLGIQKEIENLRNRYSELNSENGRYGIQADYLNKIYKECQKGRNAVPIWRGIRSTGFDTKITGLD